MTVPVYADTAFVATGDGPPGDPTLARRFREWACSWTQDTYGIDCDDPDRVEWSSGGAVIDWGEDFVHGYAHVEVRVVMARHHASAEAPTPTRACCQARRRACAAAQSNASCTTQQLRCHFDDGAWRCGTAPNAHPPASFALSCVR